MDTNRSDGYGGVTLDGNRYVLCLLDDEGKHPRYYSGRNDTPKGVERFLSRLEGDLKVLVPDCHLAMLAYERFGDKVFVLPWEPFWGTWKRAGIVGERQLSRFAALYLYRTRLPRTDLTEKQKRQVLSDSWKRMRQIMGIGDRAEQLARGLAFGEGNPALAEEVLSLEQESASLPLAVEEVEGEAPEASDSTFLSRFARMVKDDH